MGILNWIKGLINTERQVKDTKNSIKNSEKYIKDKHKELIGGFARWEEERNKALEESGFETWLKEVEESFKDEG